MWSNIVKYIGYTLNFAYIKRLIAGEENKDLREFVAVMLSFTLVVTFVYAMYVATTDDARLYLIIVLCSFIAALFGMEKFGISKPTFSSTKQEPKNEDNKELKV